VGNDNEAGAVEALDLGPSFDEEGTPVFPVEPANVHSLGPAEGLEEGVAGFLGGRNRHPLPDGALPGIIRPQDAQILLEAGGIAEAPPVQGGEGADPEAEIRRAVPEGRAKLEIS
jgi:hypothetical protein